ncbi:hypothetical protein Hypma_010909 [Hypsizygus marmoreus]|uniref:Fruit-body specific protein a n=1 Tax=Hypsizygus marmoreus TaxID=39966 RepID=A0A369JMG5_HYPMA|nr:hypothetical protein Hypma_010909 [Hypsizygus marmoreus]
MSAFMKLLCLTTLFGVALTAVIRDDGNTTIGGVTPPSIQPDEITIDNALDINKVPATDTKTIFSTVHVVDQKSGASDDTPPGQPIPDYIITAVDGKLTEAGSGGIARVAATRRPVSGGEGWVSKPPPSAYEQVFAGTGTGLTDRDGAIEGTAYLTYTVVPNSTYNVDACLAFCDRVPTCVFVNLYYELNNELLDFVFSEKSNLKCTAYSDVHNATEKTNRGGQQSYPAPAPLTYVQESSGYAAKSLVQPPVPSGYEISFGPLDGATSAPGVCSMIILGSRHILKLLKRYMGFVLLDRYDVLACADICISRDPDPVGGACQFFNIWRALVNGIPTTYTCSLYYIPATSATATNTGQGDLKVTFSSGYHRRNAYFDPGFEGFAPCASFCYAASYTAWIGTSPPGGVLDASLFFYTPYAHAGHSVALLGSATGHDNLPGTLAPAGRINTSKGVRYSILFFLASVYSGPQLEANSIVEVIWNGRVVKTIRDGYSPWKFYRVDVDAVGGDKVAFRGGKAPAWTFIDDVYIFQA